MEAKKFENLVKKIKKHKETTCFDVTERFEIVFNKIGKPELTRAMDVIDVIRQIVRTISNKHKDVKHLEDLYQFVGSVLWDGINKKLKKSFTDEQLNELANHMGIPDQMLLESWTDPWKRPENLENLWNDMYALFTKEKEKRDYKNEEKQHLLECIDNFPCNHLSLIGNIFTPFDCELTMVLGKTCEIESSLFKTTKLLEEIFRSVQKMLKKAISENYKIFKD